MKIERDPTRRIIRLAGFGIAFFGLLSYLPAAALTHSAFPKPHLYVGFVVTFSIAIFAAAQASNKGLPHLSKPAMYATMGLYLFLTWVLLQTILRGSVSEMLRAISAIALLASGNIVGRYLAHERRYREFFAGIAPYFLITFGIAMMIAIVNPDAIWWGHGIFGNSRTRSWFFWILVPQPMFAAAAFMFRRQLAEVRTPKRIIYTVAILFLLVLVLMTRTRIYILSIFALLLLIYLTRFSPRLLLASALGVVVLLAVPSTVQQVSEFTRLSSFVQGVDPVSGSTDITNGRRNLDSTLNELIRTQPFTGVGATKVRGVVGKLAASSETGVLLTFASYGAVASLLLIWYLLTGFCISMRRMVRRNADSWLYCMVAIIVPFGAVLFFGTSSSYSDWFAILCVSIAIHLPAAPVMHSRRAVVALCSPSARATNKNNG